MTESKNGKLALHEWFNKIALGILAFFAVMTYNKIESIHTGVDVLNIKMQGIEVQMDAYEDRIRKIEYKQDNYDTKWTELYKNLDK